MRDYRDENLLDRIFEFDLEGVERILAIRDENGIPRVDINNIHPFDEIRTAINYAIKGLRNSELSEESCKNGYRIIQRILAVQDNYGNPVIDLNVANALGESVLTSLICVYRDKNISLVRLRDLFDRILNLRNNDGSRAYRFERDTSLPGLLEAAVSINDPALVNTIVDLRNADGSYAVDVNQIIAPPPYGIRRTPLDYALAFEHNLDRPYGPTDKQIIEILQARGAITYD